MNPLLEEKLISLPKLKRENVASRTCKICGREAPLFDVVDFNKMCSEDNPLQFGAAGIPVAYYRCVNCDFAFTDFTDDWLQATIPASSTTMIISRLTASTQEPGRRERRVICSPSSTGVSTSRSWTMARARGNSQRNCSGSGSSICPITIRSQVLSVHTISST